MLLCASKEPRTVSIGCLCPWKSCPDLQRGAEQSKALGALPIQMFDSHCRDVIARLQVPFLSWQNSLQVLLQWIQVPQPLQSPALCGLCEGFQAGGGGCGGLAGSSCSDPRCAGSGSSFCPSRQGCGCCSKHLLW